MQGGLDSAWTVSLISQHSSQLGRPKPSFSYLVLHTGTVHDVLRGHTGPNVLIRLFFSSGFLKLSLRSHHTTSFFNESWEENWSCFTWKKNIVIWWLFKWRFESQKTRAREKEKPENPDQKSISILKIWIK